jgi:hypothetical protein
MRRLFAVLTLPLLLFALAAAQKGPDRDEEGLLGAVRSVRSQMTEYGAGEPHGRGRSRAMDSVTYDAKGNEVERTIYDDYGYLVGKEVRTHGADGNPIESVMSDPEGAVMERQVYAYSDGKLARIVHYDGQGDVGLSEVSSYGDEGRLREVTYYEGKEAVGKTGYGYDGKGRVAETAFYLKDGSRAVAPIGPCLGAHRMTFAYDDKDRPARVLAYDPDGNLVKTQLYSYNGRGQIAEDLREDAWSHTAFIYAYEYDSRGNWIKQISTVTDRPKAGRAMTGERKIIISRELVYY